MKQTRAKKHTNHKVVHNEKYDAIYCITCDEWTEPVCDKTEDCCFCKNRPEKLNDKSK